MLKPYSLFSLIFSRVIFFFLSGFVLFFLIILFSTHHITFSIFGHYFVFLFHFFSGDWGTSTLYHQNISDFIWLYFLSSSSLGAICLISSFYFGLIFSYYAIKYSMFAKWVQIILLGTPITVWAIILNGIFGNGQTTISLKENFHLEDFILPWLVITLYHSSAILQMNYFFFKTQASKEYYKILSHGTISQKRLFKEYMVKPNISFILHNLTLKVCILLGGSVGVENFFHLPGLGFMLRKSIITQDINLLCTASFLILSFITLAYLVLDIIRIHFMNKEMKV